MAEKDVEEFVPLFLRYELRLRALVMSIVLNYADAEDVLQDAHLKLWRNFGQFQRGTSFMSWAGRICYTSAMEHHRKQKRGKVKFGEAFIEAVADVASQEDVAVEAGEREKHLGDCVARLKPEHQEILRARYVEKKNAEAMGAQFNRSSAAVLNVLSRIRKALADCVERAVRREALGG